MSGDSLSLIFVDGAVVHEICPDKLVFSLPGMKMRREVCLRWKWFEARSEAAYMRGFGMDWLECVPDLNG